MIKAKFVVQSVELLCPYCAQLGTEATIYSPSGSTYWEIAEISEKNSIFAVCSECKKQSKFPKV